MITIRYKEFTFIANKNILEYWFHLILLTIYLFTVVENYLNNEKHLVRPAKFVIPEWDCISMLLNIWKLVTLIKGFNIVTSEVIFMFGDPSRFRDPQVCRNSPVEKHCHHNMMFEIMVYFMSNVSNMCIRAGFEKLNLTIMVSSQISGKDRAAL